MELNDEDMKALAMLNPDDLPITKAQKVALGKLCQSIRGFFAQMQEEGAEPERKPFKPEIVE